MTAVVIDDEPLALSHLKRTLEKQDVEILGEGQTGLDALNLAESMSPDILFMDIQMPDLTGMQAAAALMQMDKAPLLVFVTGYSKHATEAFEYAAFDYLLKPVETLRVAKTLTRARNYLGSRAVQTLEVVKELPPAKRLPVRTSYAIKLVRVEEIDYAVAKDKKVFIQTGGADLKTYYTLLQLEQLLPEDDFARIHSSAIVRLSGVEELNFLGNHSYSITLSCGAVLPVGRSYYADLQKRLGIDAG